MTKFFIDNHGCAKNQTDGELLIGFLVKNGYQVTLNADEADFILINSCGFIESAKKESIDAIYNVKNNYPNAKIILTGCLAERYSQQLYESIPELDGVFGNGSLDKIVEFMDSVSKGNRCQQTFPQEGISCGNRPYLFNYHGAAFVKITEGCSNHCSFCAIPLIRGEVRSRPLNSIIEEIKGLIEQGVYEINLIGQDLAAYEADKPCQGKSGLCQLLEEISLLKADFIVRLLYIHPDHFNKDIIPVMKKDNRFLHYFDIPFQSGDDNIIVAMNRTGPSSNYVELISTLKKELPDCFLRTTFLTGFPGETDEAAENTANFLKAISPSWSGCFPYSREEDTPAYSMKPQVSKKVAAKRAERLEQIQYELTVKTLEAFVGREVEVLIEEIINIDEEVAEDSSEGLAIGRAWFQAPEVDGSIVIRYDADDSEQTKHIEAGNVVVVKILAVTGVDLDSRFVKLKRSKINNSTLKFVY